MEQADSTSAEGQIRTDAATQHVATAAKQRKHKKRKIEYIPEAKTRQVTFCKRRHGLHKKAEELHKITNADILIITVSDTKIMHTYATPNMKHILGNKELIDSIRTKIIPVDTKSASDTATEITPKALEEDSESSISSSSSDTESDEALSDSDDTLQPSSSPVKVSVRKQPRSRQRSTEHKIKRKLNMDNHQFISNTVEV
jgi:hypothetical protein